MRNANIIALIGLITICAVGIFLRDVGKERTVAMPSNQPVRPVNALQQTKPQETGSEMKKAQIAPVSMRSEGTSNAVSSLPVVAEKTIASNSDTSRVLLVQGPVGNKRRETSPSNEHHLYLARMKEADKIERNSSPERIKQLCDVLNEKFAAQTDLSLIDFNAVKNTILDKLVSQNQIPAGLGQYMVDMYRDRSHDDLWRDYCVQHFSLYCDRKIREGGISEKDPEVNGIRAAYWDAVAETDATIAGSALLGLERLSKIDPSFDRERLKRTVLNYAMNDNTPLQTRITAMQLCGVTQQDLILPTARSVAEKTQSIPLQISAIATIGDTGGRDDVEWLQKISSSATGYAKISADSALLRLKKRLNTR